ncbi:MAG: class I SAM-dependent methyltransferase [Bacteriovoracaceae bacterium]
MGLMKNVLSYSKRKFFKYSQQRLDYQFQHNKWDWLENLDELPRYSLLTGYHRFHNLGGSVLDLGCGQGLLLKRFAPSDYSSYLAVDYSAAAIKQIPISEKVEAIEADLTTFVPPSQFDSIIFNESLYYVKKPVEQVRRYLDFLTSKGLLFTSIHTRKNFELVDELKKNFEVVDETTVVNKWGETWSCLTIRKATINVGILMSFMLELFLETLMNFVEPAASIL